MENNKDATSPHKVYAMRSPLVIPINTIMLTTLATETIYKSLSPTGCFKLCSSFITMKDERPAGNTVTTTHGVRSAYAYNIKMTRADVSVRARAHSN